MMGFQNCASEHSSKGNSNGSSAAPTPTIDQLLAAYEKAVTSIVNQKCANCHFPDSPEPVPFDNFDPSFLIQSGYVVPGEPQNSPIYLAVLDGLMPHNDDDLTSAEIETLRDWIFTLGDTSGTGGIIGAPGEDAEGGGSGGPTFSGIYATIINTNCTGCHGAAQQSAGVRLDGYARVMDYVDVDNPRASPLFNEINGGFMPTPAGFPQPTRDRYASSILEWIEDGAPNN
jgi:mono/diheme cytochrome c family protein